MTDPVLQITELSAGYHDEPIVVGFSTVLPQASITTIVGGNGAGKSTLLKAVYGLNRTFAGSIKLRGAELIGLAPRQRLARGVGFVPQGRCNFADMTVRENLLMGAYTVAKAQRQARFTEVIEVFPVLSRKWSTLAGYLSGGEQQILEMAMILVNKPTLLLLDEPSLGLSPIMQDEVFGVVQGFKNSLGVTTLIVEQNVFAALTISDTAIVMDLGRKIEEAPASTVAADETIGALYLGRKRHA